MGATIVVQVMIPYMSYWYPSGEFTPEECTRIEDSQNRRVLTRLRARWPEATLYLMRGGPWVRAWAFRVDHEAVPELWEPSEPPNDGKTWPGWIRVAPYSQEHEYGWFQDISWDGIDEELSEEARIVVLQALFKSEEGNGKGA